MRPVTRKWREPGGACADPEAAPTADLPEVPHHRDRKSESHRLGLVVAPAGRAGAYWQPEPEAREVPLRCRAARRDGRIDSGVCIM